MPAPTNLGFETEGGHVGLADGWRVRGKSTAQESLGFSPLPTVGPIADPNDFTGASWTATGVTVGANATTDPDGGSTADSIGEMVTVGLHGVENTAVALADADHYGVACFLKQWSASYAAVGIGAGTAAETFAVVDFADKRISRVVKGTGIGSANGTVFDVGGGWLLVTLFVKTSAAHPAIKPGVFVSDGTLLSYTGTAVRIYAWGASVFHDPLESAESWVLDGYLLDLDVGVTSSPATFLTSFASPNGFEDFESAWTNYPWWTTIILAGNATFGTIPAAFEGFEVDWNASHWTTLPSSSAAVFEGTEPFEDFEDGWLTSPWIVVLTAPTPATFDGDVPEAVEDFEEVVRDKVYTVDPATDTFTSASHGLPDGTTVFVVKPDGGSLPGGLNPTLRYFVRDSATDTFKLSLSNGGAAVDVTTTGEGTQKVRGDPSRYWNETGYNPTL